MKLQYKYQKFQMDAARAVVDVFAGQPYRTPFYLMDKGVGYQLRMTEEQDYTGICNQKIVSELSDDVILKRLQKIQRANGIQPSDKLEGRYNLTVEMETGVGKTYTYIKTMYELNRAYGWSKYIVVVPSVAIREGVYKAFQSTQDHFASEYGKKLRFFIYNSAQLTEIDRFASDQAISVMIINTQAFNARSKDARRIHLSLDEFHSRRPIDIIAKTNPILIIDEPQSVEGEATKEGLKKFCPLLTLRYSATHRKDSVYNMVYRLDAMEAYNKKLVKKIAVKGISETGSSATDSYVYLENINLSKSEPTATLQFDVKQTSSVKPKGRIVKKGDNLYDYSNGLEEYKNNFVVKAIDGRDDSVEFLNGIKIYAGDVIGKVDEDQLRRLQIRETIISHIERERKLFSKGIKVLSLFFIDEVANYREYDEAGQTVNGKYADMFEEEYNDVINTLQTGIGEDDYISYLKSISPQKTHSGYFSIDGKGKMVNSKVGRRETTSDDVSAYELIMKNKELLLDRDPMRSPVRFIFSHSALREGWDNPNVFQICMLKQSSSEVRKRQEVGRGLRLCVNQEGERLDTSVLGNEIHDVNVLTVIASESYESFVKGLQSEIADAVADRPRAVTIELFAGKVIKDAVGNELVVDQNTARAIYHGLIVNGYVDKNGALTDQYYSDKTNGVVKITEEVADAVGSVIELIDSVYKPIEIENPRENNVELHLEDEKLSMPEFRALWSKINAKSVYIVDFDTDELIRKSIDSLNKNLNVPKISFRVESGLMEQIKSKEELTSGESFKKQESAYRDISISANSNVRYDLIGKLVDETGLTRKAIIDILQGIESNVFDQFKNNPEEFILKAGSLINDQKATVIIEHITYNLLDDRYGIEIFTDSTIRGKLGTNAMKVKKHLYDHVVFDSSIEEKFVEALDTDVNVAVYVKLPSGFYISTPVGKYNPDWAIAFYEGNVKHIYFVAETKGSMSSMQLRLIEESKIHCARQHFKTISGKNVVYDVVDSYRALLDRVLK